MEYANPFTLHLFARNADKHRGSEDEMQILTLHPPSSFCYFQISTDRQSLAHASIKAIICLLLRHPVKVSMMLALRLKSLLDKPSSTSMTSELARVQSL